MNGETAVALKRLVATKGSIFDRLDSYKEGFSRLGEMIASPVSQKCYDI